MEDCDQIEADSLAYDCGIIKLGKLPPEIESYALITRGIRAVLQGVSQDLAVDIICKIHNAEIVNHNEFDHQLLS